MTIKFEPNSGVNCNDDKLSKISSIYAEMYLTDCDIEYLLKEFVKKLGYKIDQNKTLYPPENCIVDDCFNHRTLVSQFCMQHHQKNRFYRGLCIKYDCINKRIQDSKYCEEHRRESEYPDYYKKCQVPECDQRFYCSDSKQVYCFEHQKNLREVFEKHNIKSESEHKLELRLEKLETEIKRLRDIVELDWDE